MGRRSVAVVTALLVAVGTLRAAEPAKDARLARLQRQVEAFAKSIPGPVGVAIKHVESGQEIRIRGDEKFPMASTFKVPLLLEVFAQEKDGQLSLDDEVILDGKHQHLGSGQISSYRLPGVKMTVRNLCELMMIVSDNSATDWLLERVTVEKVNAGLKAAGVTGIRVDRPCQGLILDYLGLDRKEHEGKPVEELDSLAKKLNVGEATYTAARQRYYSDGRDSSTPAGMNALLEKIFRAEVLDRKRCDEMLAIMKRCQSGEARLKGLLPPGTVVAHKTGTVGTTVNDVGVIYLPDKAGHVVISVFTKDPGNDGGMYDRGRAEKVIAQIARAAHDYFLFTAPVKE